MPIRTYVSALGLAAATLLTGCSTSFVPQTLELPGTQIGLIKGNFHGGQQPVAGARVYLLAAGTSAYGAASTSLITTGSAGSDSVGKYVLTDANGNFALGGTYTCIPGTQVYLYGLGGNPGSGDNSAAGLMAVLGQCPNSGNLASQVPFVNVNEVTTIAAAYAFSAFATDASHVSSSGSSAATTGIANAFANAASLADIASGASRAAIPVGIGQVPQSEINTLANILAACINSTGSTSLQCTFLFAFSRSAGTSGTAATDTATAAINIAHNPTQTTLYGLQTAQSPFQPSLSSTPNDFTVSIIYYGNGIYGADGLAIDAAGNAWVTSFLSAGVIVKLSPTGVPLSGAAGYSGGGLTYPVAPAIDNSGNLWVTNSNNNAIDKLNASGNVVSPSPGYTGGGLLNPTGIAVDAAGAIWVVSSNNSSLNKFSTSGTAISTSAGYTGGGLHIPFNLAIDSGSNVWATSNLTNTLSKFSNAGVAISGSTGFTGGGLNGPRDLAIDASNNVWVANMTGASISKFSSTGVALSGTSGYTGGGLSTPYSVAVDGLGNVWVSNFSNSSTAISEFSSTGVALSPSTGFQNPNLYYTYKVAIDESGNVWTANYYDSCVTEFIGAAAPVVTPLGTAISTGMIATRP